MRRGLRKRNQSEFASEGRQYPRVFLNLPVEYYSDSQVPRPGHTCNVSQGGVMLNIGEKLIIGQSIDLAIFFSLGPQVEAIKVNSRVVWVKNKGEKDGTFLSGVKFVNLSPSDEGKLQNFFETF